METFKKVGPDLRRVGDQALLLNDFEVGERCGRTNRVAAIGQQVLERFVLRAEERVGNLFAGDGSADWQIPAAQGLGYRRDIRLDVPVLSDPVTTSSKIKLNVTVQSSIRAK